MGKTKTQRRKSPINRRNIEPTISSILLFLSKYGYTNEDIVLLGSTGKREVSGDLDIGILYKDDLDIKTILSDIIEQFDDANFYFGNQITFPFPITNYDGQQKDQFVKVDLMFTTNLETCSMYYYAPDEGVSKYKGLHRNNLMMALAIHHKRSEYPDQRITCRHWWDRNLGLAYGFEIENGKKRNAYGKISIAGTNEEVMKELFGDYLESMDTFEEVWSAIHDPRFYNRGKLDMIVETFKGIEKRNGATLPEEVVDAEGRTGR